MKTQLEKFIVKSGGKEQAAKELGVTVRRINQILAKKELPRGPLPVLLDLKMRLAKLGVRL